MEHVFRNSEMGTWSFKKKCVANKDYQLHEFFMDTKWNEQEKKRLIFQKVFCTNQDRIKSWQEIDLMSHKKNHFSRECFHNISLPRCQLAFSQSEQIERTKKLRMFGT